MIKSSNSKVVYVFFFLGPNGPCKIGVHTGAVQTVRRSSRTELIRPNFDLLKVSLNLIQFI